MFTTKYTKWLPILIYDFSGNKYLLQGRRNLNTGELCFKNTRLNTAFNLMQSGSVISIFDPKLQFETILREGV